MGEIIVTYKGSKALQAIRNLTKSFDIVIRESGSSKRERKSYPDRELPITFAKEPNANALSGIWAECPKTLEEIRKSAWDERL